MAFGDNIRVFFEGANVHNNFDIIHCGKWLSKQWIKYVNMYDNTVIFVFLPPLKY